MDKIFETITHPWREPVAYSQLVFWFVIFLVAAYAMMDGLRVAGQFAKETVKGVV